MLPVQHVELTQLSCSRSTCSFLAFLTRHCT